MRILLCGLSKSKSGNLGMVLRVLYWSYQSLESTRPLGTIGSIYGISIQHRAYPSLSSTMEGCRPQSFSTIKSSMRSPSCFTIIIICYIHFIILLLFHNQSAQCSVCPLLLPHYYTAIIIFATNLLFHHDATTIVCLFTIHHSSI